MKIENWPIPFWHLLSIKQLDTSRELDQKDRAEFGAWVIGCLLATGMMAVNDFDGFKLGRFRLQGFAGIALTCVAVHVTDKATRKYAEVYGVMYRNEAQRNMDEAVTETTVFYQHQTAQIQAKWQQYVAQLTAQHDSEIDGLMNDSSEQVRALKAQHQEAIQNLQYQISDYVTDVEVLEERERNLKAQKFHEQEQARCDAEEAREYLENDRRAIQQMRDELALSEQRLEAREHQIKHEAEQIWRDERDRLQAEQQRIDDYQAQLDAIEEGYKQQAMQMAQEAVMAEIEGYQDMITMLRDEIGSMLCSKRIKGSNREALVANNILDALEDMGVFLKKTIYGYDGNNVWVAGDPLPTINGEKINPDMALAYIWEELDKPKPLKHIQASVGALNLPTVKFCNADERLRIDVDLTPVDKSAVAEQQAEQEQFEATYFVPDSGDKDILHMVQNNFHIGVQGESGAGKTTLLDEIIHAVVGVMGDDVEIKYGSTKPDPKSTTLHLVTANDTQTYLEFLLDAFVNVEYRLLMNRRYADEVKHLHPDARHPKPTFPPLFYLADEINDSLNDIADLTELDLQDAWATLGDRYSGNDSILGIIAHQAERMAVKTVGPKCLKKVWNLGRSEHVKFVYFGQDLMPKGLDNSGTIKRNNVYNNAMIAIGDKSIELAIEFMVKAPSERERILEEYNRMKNAIGDEVINRFQGLFVSKGDDPCVYFAPLPAPGTYRSSIIMNQLQEYPEHSIPSIYRGIESDEMNTVQEFSDNHQGKDECSPEHSNTSQECLAVLNPLTEKGYSEHLHNFSTPKNLDKTTILEHSNTEHSPLDRSFSVSFYTDAIRAFSESRSIAKTVKSVFGLHTSKAIEYQVAKWKVRHVLNSRNVEIEKKTNAEDRKRDRMNYDELIDYLERGK